MASHQIHGKSRMDFVLAGNATFTVRSTKTGTRFTYRARISKRGGVAFIRLLCGPDNTSNYRYVGFIRDGKFIYGGRKAKVRPNTPGILAAYWFFEFPESALVEFYHAGRCGRCGRKLTVPESIESGFGPMCSAERLKGQIKLAM